MLRTISLLAGLGLFCYLILRLGPGTILTTMASMGWSFLVVLVIYTAYEFVRGLSLRRCLRGDRTLSYFDIFWIQIFGEAVQLLTSSGPFLSQPSKAWLLARRGFSLPDAFAATITEYLIDCMLAAVVCVSGLAYIVRHFELAIPIATALHTVIYLMLAFLLVAAVAILFRIHLIGAAANLIARLPVIRGRINFDTESLHQMEAEVHDLFWEEHERLFAMLLLDGCAQFLLIFESYWILKSLSHSSLPLFAFLVESATKFISLVFFFIPGQFGAQEGTYAVLFRTLGLGAATGFAMSFLRHLRALILAGLGLGAMWFVGHHPRQHAA